LTADSSRRRRASSTAARPCSIADGKLVGIGSLWVSDALEAGAAFPGNMFVPLDLLTPLLDDILATGKRRGPARPWVGLYSEEIQGTSW
jgi:hypothetical protein